MAVIFVRAIEKFGVKEGAEGVKEGGGVEDVEADVHEFVRLVGLGAAGEALDLAKEGAAEDVLEDGVVIVIVLLGRRRRLLGFVVAGVNEEAEELVGVFLAAKSKVPGEEAEVTADLGGDEWGVVENGGVGKEYLALEQAKRADGRKDAAVGIVGGGRRRSTRRRREGGGVGGGADGGVGVGEAKVGKGRRVGEALEDAVDVAGVAQILETQRR